MKVLFAPGIAVMGKLSNQKKLPLISALFILPFGILYYDTYAGLSVAENVGVWVALALAVYAMTSFYLQAGTAWGQLMGLTRRVAQGDLTARLETRLSGQFGLMMEALMELTRSLGQIVSQVRSSSHAVAHSATEIAAGNSNLSQRTEQQASTLEETASGMEELAGTVKQNADNCKLASDLAQQAELVAKQGAQAVHGVVGGMGKIDQSSKRMADIIGVIEGIAFQTNILALNAAVEAARAGEQGRGFAVVASEVRALAQRSADAAKEIRALIQQSVAQISDGSKQAEGAGKVIDDIVVSVQQVNQLIGEIAVASSEQSAGVGEINKAILQLEGVTQQNAALVEEASAASLTFQEQADRLRDLVARFKVHEAASPAPKAAVAPKAPAAAPLPKADAGVRARPLPRKAAGHKAVGAEDEWKEF
jgi:methyl-accepting chemotaxis protein